MLKPNKYILSTVFCLSFFQVLLSQVNSIPRLKIWLRADTLITETSGLISNWRDASGNNYDFSESNPVLQPTFQSTSSLNSKPTILFSGSDILQSLASFSFTDCSIFCIASQNTGDGAYGRLIDQNATPGFWLGRSNNNNQFGGGFLEGNAPYGNFENISNDAPFTYSIIRQNNVSWSYMNNQPFSVPTRTTLSGPTNNSPIALGSALGASAFGNKNIYEIIIFDSVVSPANKVTIETYLNNKYAPPVLLPSDITMTDMCDTMVSPINPNNNFYTYLWSTGQTTSTITINAPGKYWLTGTNIFGRASTDTINVIYPGNYLSDFIFCGGGTKVWNTDLPKNQYTFQWHDNSTDSIFTINQAGSYYVKITDIISGCSVNSNTVTVLEDNFTSNTFFLGPDDSICSGNYITLVTIPSAVSSYTWNDGTNNDSLLINTAGQYSIAITNTNSCVARDTINIAIKGQAPIANFTTSIGCDGSAMSFTNLSSAAAGNTITATNWSFGDPISMTSNTSTVSNPFHTFSDTGNYSVHLTVITNAGCEQSITKTIHISPTPTVNFSMGNSCQNDSTAFSNLSTSSAGYSITSLNWNFGDPGPANTSTLSNPKHVFGSQTTYTVSLTATNNAGCSSTLSNTLAVKAQVKADFTYSTPCTNTTTVFQDNSIASSTGANTRSWNFGGPPVSGLTVPRIYTATGPYNVSLTVIVNGCTSTINKIITIFSPPLVSFTIPAFCSKDTITAINSSVAQSGVISSYNWRLNNNSFSSVQNPTLSLTAAGNYPVRLTVVNSFGCKDSLTKTVTVNPLPVVDFTTNPTNYYYINEPIGFTPSITNAASYFWNVSSITTSTLQAPSVTINSEGTYTVSLNLQDQQGCKNSKTKTILVSKRYLDLAILNVTTIKDDDGFMTVVADIANYGTVPATTINLQYQISDGGNNKESWIGVLNPNSYFSYTFNSKSASQVNGSNNITCVAIKKVNGVDDENQNNNDLCSALYYDEVSVSNPFPNPTAENLTLPVILNKDIDYTIAIYNTTGQTLYEETIQKGSMGLNLVSIPTSSYARGCYIIKVVIDDKLFIKKFIKVNN